MGVWIETRKCCRQWWMDESLPAWECGLKPRVSKVFAEPSSSLPAWECGLKLQSPSALPCLWKSLPAWECGLKLQLQLMKKFAVVTPRVGVWIETPFVLDIDYWFLSLPAWECGLKQSVVDARVLSVRHSPRGSVD